MTTSTPTTPTTPTTPAIPTASAEVPTPLAHNTARYFQHLRIGRPEVPPLELVPRESISLLAQCESFDSAALQRSRQERAKRLPLLTRVLEAAQVPITDKRGIYSRMERLGGPDTRLLARVFRTAMDLGGEKFVEVATAIFPEQLCNLPLLDPEELRPLGEFRIGGSDVERSSWKSEASAMITVAQVGHRRELHPVAMETIQQRAANFRAMIEEGYMANMGRLVDGLSGNPR